uniref:Uncharacterized protein n=1 Tax=Anser cygnoides TaxID=8845 RepID=A0A8B9IP99_ANSCY
NLRLVLNAPSRGFQLLLADFCCCNTCWKLIRRMFSPDGRCSPGDGTERNREQCSASQLVSAFDSLLFPYQLCSGLLGALIISSSFSLFILGLLPRERRTSRA